MKALYKAISGPGAVFGPVADLKPAPDGLVIKVHRASICGSDLPIYHWNSWAPSRIKVPLVFGHEFCGTVASIGKKVQGFKAGDFVSVESHIYCAACERCREGLQHVCREMKIIGLDGPGGFAEYAAIPARCAWKHRGAKLRDLGSLLEPFGNAVYSVLVEEVKDRSVLVLGCGPQGLFSVAVAKASGARNIVAVESSAYRAALARRLGASEVVEASLHDVLKRVLKAGRCPGGFDAAVEMSGAPAAVSLALKAVKNGGRVTAFGIPSRNVEIDWANDIIFKGIRIHGIVGRKIFDTWKTADRLLSSGAVDLRPVVTHTFPMADYEEAFAVMSSPEKKCGKVLLVP